MVANSSTAPRYGTTHSAKTIAQIGGEVKTWDWLWQNRPYPIIYEIRGAGSPVLLLPAFSTVSSRSEMQELADRLSANYQVIALDWLGFGQSSRPALNYRPALYQQLLTDFAAAMFDRPPAVIAAGHAAGYAMLAAHQQPHIWSKLVLVAPTWKGPLRAMGAGDLVRDAVRELVRSPGVGQVLYALNTTPAFLKLMYRRHVYTDANRLTPDFMQQKYAITQQPGARFAPAAFVTATLDPMPDRETFLQIGRSVLGGCAERSLSVPAMVIIGEQSPPQSKAEMAALAALPNVQSVTLPGTLGMHEEYGIAVAEAVLPFLNSSQ